MALKKKIEKFGYDFEYNMISHMNYSKEDNTTIILVSLYKNQETREEDIHNFADIFEFKAHGNITIEQAYNFLKHTQTYKNAEDC